MTKYRVILTYNLGDRRRTWNCSVAADSFGEAATEAMKIYYARESDTPKYIETVTVSVEVDRITSDHAGEVNPLNPSKPIFGGVYDNDLSHK